MGERGDVTCSKGPGFEPQLAAFVYVLNFAMPWPPHTSFVSHLGHPSKNVLDTPLDLLLKYTPHSEYNYLFGIDSMPNRIGGVVRFKSPCIHLFRIDWGLT